MSGGLDAPCRLFFHSQVSRPFPHIEIELYLCFERSNQREELVSRILSCIIHRSIRHGEPAFRLGADCLPFITFLTLSRILSATSILPIKGTFSILPSAPIIFIMFVS